MSFTNKKSQKKVIGLALLSMFMVSAVFILHSSSASAATLTVDTKADNTTADASCTLREAITNVNNQTDTYADCAGAGSYGVNDTIEFEITGTADYTISGQSGYTLTIGSLLPAITKTVIIDGYSQSGAQANTAASPAPLNSRLLIELNGNNGAYSCIRLNAGSDGSSIRGLVINRFQGIAIQFLGTNDSDAVGNYLGTDPTGLIARPNGTDNISSPAAISIGEDGTVLPDTDTQRTTVGGLSPADRNLVSGNYGGGFAIQGVDTIVQGNYVGINILGVSALPNATGTNVGTGGFTVDYADQLLIGGDAPAAANVISGNMTGGIQPDYSTNITIQGNYIGTDYTGNSAVPNGWNGISINFDTTGVVIGGGTPGAGNIIKFNGRSAVYIETGSDVTVQGNTIEGDISDTNTLWGIRVENADDITIEDNDIAANTFDGISVDAATNIIVRDNTVSDNEEYGIELINSSSISLINNTITANIGGMSLTDASNNLITGNTIESSIGSGVSLDASSSGSNNNTITGNTVMDNGNAGLAITGSSNNTVGGTESADGNVVSGNSGQANIFIIGFGTSASENIIQGNYIGTNVSGEIDGSYAQNAGIILSGTVSNSVIGGTQPGAGNIIAGNNAAGVIINQVVISGNPVPPTDNSILGNSIRLNDEGMVSGYSVPGLGIEIMSTNLDGSFVPLSIEEDGPNINDLSDTDSGPNAYMNHPVLNDATQDGTSLSVNLGLDAADSTLNNEYRVEFFANDTADPSGYGEGQTYLGYADVSNGDANAVTITLPADTNLTGKVLSATTTAFNSASSSGFGATSEFSQVKNVNVLSVATDSGESANLAKTGAELYLMAIPVVMIAGSVTLVLNRHKARAYSAR